MDDLRGALRDLARSADLPAPADADDLWRRGRTRVWRHRFAGVAAVAVIAAVIGAGSFAVSPRAAVGPADGGSVGFGIPKDVWAAQGWFAGTADDGPPGVVAVLGGVLRGDRNGLFSISARTGAYRLLDLPGLADLDGGAEATLAPDGRHIAYWLTGEPSGTPAPDEGSDLPMGVAVYDTVSGDVERYLPETEHGISADALVWLDDDALLLSYGQRTSATSATDIRSFSWRIDGEEPRESPVPAPFLVGEAMRNRSGNLLGKVGDQQFGALGEQTVDRTAVVTLPPAAEGEGYGQAAISGEGLAVVEVQTEDGPELRTGSYGDEGTVTGLQRLPALADATFVSWLDGNSVLIIGPADAGDEWGTLSEVDLRTGERTRIGTAEGGMYGQGLSFATDLFRLPLVEGRRPPSVDPRWWNAGGAAGAIVLGALVLGWMRRRRA